MIRPLRVRGPVAGSVQPILRFSVRTLAEALTTKLSARSRNTSLCRMLVSDVNSPTISSSRSSSVTRPCTSPYSSTTNATRRRHELVAVALAAHEHARHLLHVQDADQRLEVALVDGDASVPAVTQLLDDVVPVVGQVDAVDLLPRHHDVVDRDLLEVEDAHEHALVAMRDDGAGFGDHRAQFLAAQGRPVDLLAPD